MDAMTEIMRALWIGGLAATPLALGVGILCRAKAWSAATRHLLWLAVLTSFVTPAIGLFVWRPNWFGTANLMGAAERVIAQLPLKAAEDSTAPAISAERKGNRSFAPSTFMGPVLLPSLIPDNAARFAIDEPRAFNSTPVPASLSVHGGGESPILSSTGAVNAATLFEPAPASSMRMTQPARARVAPSAARSTEETNAPVAYARIPNLAPATSPPINPARTPAPSTVEPRAAELIRRSAASLIDLRDSLASTSPIPMSLWLGVAGLLIVVRLARTLKAGRLLRFSEPADPRVCSMVKVVAEQVGLSKAPEARMVDAAISPMIWCGLRPRLILPRGLWNALDESSQRAVLVHELAHVRRWDHVLCWVDLVIGSLYWWHPLSWWARRRLHDEAEASCDAWVVSTLPESRRAYATALLATKSFVSMQGRVSGPWLAGGVGVLSGSAKKMARRITMVMTQKSVSGLSLVGACAAASVIALGAFVMPGLACPPDTQAEKERTAKTAAELANSAGVIVVTPAPTAKRKNKHQNDGSEGAGAQFFGEAPALEAMKSRRSSQELAPLAPMAPMPPEAPTPAAPPRFPSGVLMRVGPKPAAIGKSGQCGVSRSRAAASTDDLKAGRIARVYALPPGKSDALWELLSRGDVPILVQQRGNSIVVYATEEQHPMIAGFIQIINPGGNSEANPDSENGARHGSGHGAGHGAGQRTSDSAAATSRAYQAQARAYQQALRELNTARAAIERNADRTRAEADRVREEHERLEEMTERLQGQAQELEAGESRQAIERAAQELRQRAHAADQRARSTDEQVEQIEKQIEELEQRAEELEERASEAAESEDDRIAELDSAVSEADSVMESEMGEIGEMGEVGEVVGPAEVDESETPDMDDEDDETPVAAPAPTALPAAASPVAPAEPVAPIAPAAPAPKAHPTPAAVSVVASNRQA